KTTPAASASVASLNLLDDAATPPCSDARRGMRLLNHSFTADAATVPSSSPSQIVILHRERTNAFSGRGEDGVAHSRGDPSDHLFAHAGDRFICCPDKMNTDFRHLQASQQREVVKIALDDSALLNCYLLLEHSR